MVDDPPDDSIDLHLPELLDEHLLGDSRDRPFQVREAQHLASEEMEQDHQLPAAPQNLEGILDASGRRSRRQIITLTFRKVPYFSVCSCHLLSLFLSLSRHNGQH